MKNTCQFKKGFGVVLMAASVFLSPRTDAAVLTTYDFTGLNGLQATTASSNVAEHLTASSISRGAYAGGPTAVNAFFDNSMGFNIGRSTTNPNDLAAATLVANYTLATSVANNAYFEITFDIEEGYSVSIDSILFGTHRASQNSGANFVGVRSSLDGFTSNLLTGVSTIGAGGNVSLNMNFDFGMSLQNVTESVTLRFYGYGRNQTGVGTGSWALTNPVSGASVGTVNGSIAAVPEPSTYLLLGASGIVVFALRKRSKANSEL